MNTSRARKLGWVVRHDPDGWVVRNTTSTVLDNRTIEGTVYCTREEALAAITEVEEAHFQEVLEAAHAWIRFLDGETR